MNAEQIRGGHLATPRSKLHNIAQAAEAQSSCSSICLQQKNQQWIVIRLRRQWRLSRILMDGIVMDEDTRSNQGEKSDRGYRTIDAALRYDHDKVRVASCKLLKAQFYRGGLRR